MMGNSINYNMLQEALGIKLVHQSRLKVSKVSNGWNIRIIAPPITKPTISFREKLIQDGIDMDRCAKCGKLQYCHPHHIIPTSAGGEDDVDNGIPLCFGCHVGDNGIHNGKWAINSLINDDTIFELKRRYHII